MMGGFGMGIFVIVLVGIVILLALSLSKRGRIRETLGPSPLDILKQRYARGEIGKEEFEEKKNQLK